MLEDIPASFARDCKTLTVAELAVRHGKSERTIGRWRAFLGLCKKPIAPDDLPEDVEELAQFMSIKGMASHYGWGKDTFRTALKRLRPDLCKIAAANGVEERRAAGRTGGKDAAKAAKLKRLAERRAKGGNVALVRPPEEKAVLAMSYLRPWGSCYPLKVRYPERDGYWFYGREWTDEQLIAEAKRRGWVPLDEMTF